MGNFRTRLLKHLQLNKIANKLKDKRGDAEDRFLKVMKDNNAADEFVDLLVISIMRLVNEYYEIKMVEALSDDDYYAIDQIATEEKFSDQAKAELFFEAVKLKTGEDLREFKNDLIHDLADVFEITPEIYKQSFELMNSLPEREREQKVSEFTKEQFLKKLKEINSNLIVNFT